MEYKFADYGTVKCKDGVVSFKDATWAAGIWAGTEGMPIEITGPEGSMLAKIVAVDLDGRKLHIDNKKTVSIWSTITPWHEVVEIYGGPRGAV